MAAYSIGSGVEAMANAPDQQGPRLEDLAVQMSTYGAPIPHEWGINRHAGTVIWPKNLMLKESSETESAKGGPEMTTYTYSCSIAVLMCEGPIKGVRRIWANKKIIYDASAENTGPNKDPAIGAMRIYTGTETQEVDPLIEATDGPSPAYLGYAYAVFEDFDLTEYANRPPQFEFEIITKGEQQPDVPPYKFGDFVSSANVGKSVVVPDNNTLWVVNGGNTNTKGQTGGALDGPCINVYDLTTKELLAIISNGRDSGTSYYFQQTGQRAYGDLAYSDGMIYTSTPVSAIQSGYAAYGFSVESMAQVVTVPYTPHSDGVLWASYPGTIAAAGGGLLLSATSTSTAGGGEMCLWNPDSGVFTNTVEGNVGAFGYFVQALTLDDGRIALIGPAGLLIVTPVAPILVSATVPVADFGGAVPTHMAYDPQNKRLMVTAGALWAVDVASPDGTINDVAKVMAGPNIACSVYDPVSEMYYVARQSADVVAISASSFSVDRTVSLSPMSDAPVDMHLSATTGELILVGAHSVWALKVDDVLAPEKIALSKIVGDLCTMKSGLLASQVDVTALTPLVDGYPLSRQMTRRAAIEALQPIYGFDAVENAAKIQFVMRGGEAVAVIPDEDRSAREFGADLPDGLSITRAQDLELPVEVELEYPDVDADHLVGAQYSRRLTKDTRQKVNMQTAVVMSATKAKAVTEVNLYESWLQTTFRWTTTRKYSHLLPTDVVELPTRAANYRARITMKREQPNGVIEWEGKQEAMEVYTLTGTGAAPTNYVSQSIYSPEATDLELLDIPMLRDADNDAGFYVAMG